MTRDDAALPRELRSLIHHVELNRSGWWNRSLERLVLVTLWRHSPASSEDVLRVLSASLDGRLSRERIEGVLARAEATGTVVQTSDGRYKPSEEVDRSLRQELEAVTVSEVRLQERLSSLATAAGVEVDPAELWTEFERLFMHPLVQEAGARIYDVLTSGAGLETASPTYGEILNRLCERYGHEIRSVLVDFLDPADVDVRSYVLRTLNADFVREAAGLDPAVLDALRTSRGRPDRVRVFLDTNFLFSFLGLHDNPSNEVAVDLIKLIARAKSTIRVELFILPITVEETRRVLQEVMVRLSGVIPLPNLAAAARALSSTGLVARFLEAASNHSGGPLTPDDFFGPYESNLVPVVRERGVELFNTDLDGLRVDQGVIDDIHDQTEVQERVRKRGAKSYEANLHDMVLWHFAHRERPAGVDSPLEVGNWVCTVDYGLVAFDRHKRRGTRQPPVCLTPSSLIQLLQFWVPRTEELDRALVGAIREPLLFLDFDPGTEQATLRILRSISRFEGVGDLETSTIYNILTNDALRARIHAAPDMSSDEEAALVEATVVEEARRLESELAELQSEKASLAEHSHRQLEAKEREAEGLRDVLATRDQDVSVLSAEVDILRRRLEEERQASQVKVSALESGHRKLRARLGEIESERKRAGERRRVIAVFAVASAIAAAGVIAGGLLLDDLLGGSSWVVWSGVSTAGTLLLLLVGEQALKRAPSYMNGTVRQLVARWRKGIAFLLVGILASLVGTAVWESVNTDKERDRPSIPETTTTAAP